MSFASLLLRLVMCLGLLAHGVGQTRAAAPMQSPHSEVAAHAQATAAEMPAGCHGATAQERPAAPAAVGHSAQDDAAAGDSHDGGCCEGPSCQCTCPGQASLPLTAAAPSGSASRPPDAAPTGTSRRAEPRLPHLIRPPIG